MNMSRIAAILYLSLMAVSLHAQSAATTNAPTTAPDKAAQVRLKWNVSTLLGGYEQHGQHNPKWDTSAKEALTNLALAKAGLSSATTEASVTKLSGALKTALTKGCTDPLLQYLQARFVLASEDVGWHHNYALYAYRAGDWDVLNRQLPLLGLINYEFFGGKQAFDEMVHEAKAHAAK